MWYSVSLPLLVVTLLFVPSAGQHKKTRNAIEKRPYARILESRVLPSGALRIVVPYEDTFIRNGRRVARVRAYYCKKKIIETNAGREFYTMGYCRPIVWYRRTANGSTMPPTSTEFTTGNGESTDITSAADPSNDPTLEITTTSPAVSTTTSSVQTDVAADASSSPAPETPTESATSEGSATTATEGQEASAATESMTTTITMLNPMTSAPAAAAPGSRVKVVTKNHARRH